MSVLRRAAAILFLALAMAYLPGSLGMADAHAQPAQGFSCNPDGTASGRLFPKQTCTITTTSIMAGTVCSYEQTLSDIFSNLYCSTALAVQTPLFILMSLAMMVFGLMFLTGMTRLTTGEASKIAFKILLVWVFATQAEYAIGIGYQFFMSTAKEGINVVLNVVRPTTALGAQGVDNAMHYIDDLIVEAASPINMDQDALNQINNGQSQQAGGTCQNAFIALLVLTAILIPPLFIMVVYVVLQTLFVFVRAVLGYLLAITGITFLMTMAPLFLCFALFKMTYKFFEKWLQYLVSFTLQMIVIFAFLAFTQLMEVSKFLGRILELIKPYSGTIGAGSLIPKDANSIPGVTALFDNIGINLPMCSLCEFHIEKLGYYNMEVPVCNTPIKVMPPTDIMFHTDFAYTLIIYLTSLGVLAYVLEAFLRYVPEIAKQIAGSPYSARIGGHVESNMGRFIGTQGGSPNLMGEETLRGASRSFLDKFDRTPGYSPGKLITATRDVGREIAGGARGSLLRPSPGEFMTGNPKPRGSMIFKSK